MAQKLMWWESEKSVRFLPGNLKDEFFFLPVLFLYSWDNQVHWNEKLYSLVLLDQPVEKNGSQNMDSMPSKKSVSFYLVADFFFLSLG